MKTYAAKKQDGSIYIIHCDGSPENFLQDPENDTLLNEITEANPLPDKKYRDSWADSSGDVAVAQADIDAKDRGDKLDAIRDYRQSLLDTADKEIFKLEDASGDASSWRTYRQALRDITDSYKDVNGDPTSALDAVEDIESDVSWPVAP